ncbi:LOW QUALITY PROTEIN: thiosulfate sulfurtransferase/rhodanese-like domain-containing protein 2 [Hippocampus comes]|uniref:LOW QUALITY PROTEIN: thiosulfate sulfurtransferase/rhodanese-like domain-containing protein 2 n=1 Tax=Hippocampus comes TaxID=109280 RepID=UPI00094E96FD|nr:PREDICTED: LOW QUALITY PROTEIN: thiosulfate sulfurtransferase/rhodanese-like domain-containing protein 2 [Hippocampus comes]
MTSVCSEFLDWNLENVCSPNVLKEEKQLCASLRRFYNLSRRKSFAAFVASKQEASLEVVGSPSWCCCGCVVAEQAAIHQHVARLHGSEIQQLARAQYNHSLNKGQEEKDNAKPHNESSSMEVTAWMPDISHIPEEQLEKGPGKVLLYYRYCHVEEPHIVCAWQRALCQRLHLTGKVRVATEGINGTVGGTCVATEVYVDAMCSHPLFQMEKEDFKTSDGGPECFTELKVGVFEEIVPIGLDPDVLSYHLAGTANVMPGDLRSKNVCKEVYQLKGGIHKYLERFPDGFYRGKLFVFDERYAISSNDDVIAGCRYCGRPWDRYQLCTTRFCCQLVLSCPTCRSEGHTACCPGCLTGSTGRKEGCECTEGRPRIPQDVNNDGKPLH